LKAGQCDDLSVTTTPRWPMVELTAPDIAIAQS
jgi:N6-L-threonylcarbamoyladenine synthase